MQLTEHWGNMAKFALHNDKTGGLRFELSATLSILHLLQSITVVYSATKKRVDKSRSCIH